VGKELGKVKASSAVDMASGWNEDEHKDEVGDPLQVEGDLLIHSWEDEDEVVENEHGGVDPVRGITLASCSKSESSSSPRRIVSVSIDSTDIPSVVGEMVRLGIDPHDPGAASDSIPVVIREILASCEDEFLDDVPSAWSVDSTKHGVDSVIAEVVQALGDWRTRVLERAANLEETTA
jgi:hypothetical protein